MHSPPAAGNTGGKKKDGRHTMPSSSDMLELLELKGKLDMGSDALLSVFLFLIRMPIALFICSLSTV